MQSDIELWKGAELMTCQMFCTYGLLRLFSSPMCPVAALLPWALDLRRSRQHSASLSDRCLPPKQWIIRVLHLSGGTHLVWSAGFLLLFPVMAWHPQSAYPAPFWGSWQADALSLSYFTFLSLSFPSPSAILLHLFLPLLFFSYSRIKSPKSNEQRD